MPHVSDVRFRIPAQRPVVMTLIDPDGDRRIVYQPDNTLQTEFGTIEFDLNMECINGSATLEGMAEAL